MKADEDVRGAGPGGTRSIVRELSTVCIFFAAVFGIVAVTKVVIGQPLGSALGSAGAAMVLALVALVINRFAPAESAKAARTRVAGAVLAAIALLAIYVAMLWSVKL